MHLGDTRAQRTEKFLRIPSVLLFMEDLFQVNPKKALHLPFLFASFFLLPKGRDNPMYFQLCGFILY